jgi:hypothetical protein
MEEHHVEHPFTQFERALKRLQRPAGDDPRFATFGQIKQNAEPFVLECNKAFKELHYISITHQFALEKFLAMNAGLSKAVKVDVQYLKCLWERINDTIVWEMFGEQRHLIKRLCMRQPRRPLAACNPDSVIPVLKQINADPFKIAVWTDATGIVDIGDILCHDRKTGDVLFLEVKGGEVNEDILRTLKTSACPWTVHDFFNRRGEKGAEQMMRVIEQMKLNSQVSSFLREEKGFDPSTGQNVEIMDLTDIPEKDWDRELEQVLRASETEDGSISCVDDTLWLFAKTRTTESVSAVEQEFTERIAKIQHPTALKWMKEYAKGDSFPSIVSMQQWVSYVQSRPLFCRNLAVEDMLSILKGKKCVLMFFDWSAFSHLLSQLGVTLEWSSRKGGRREKSKPQFDRLLLVGDRMPILRCGDTTLHLGDSRLLRIFFDGVRPSTLAAHCKRTFELLAERFDKKSV